MRTGFFMINSCQGIFWGEIETAVVLSKAGLLLAETQKWLRKTTWFVS